MEFSFRIRPLEMTDLRDINEMRSMRGVMETTPILFTESPAFTEGVMRAFGDNDHMLAAVTEVNGVDKVVGLGGLHVAHKARARHSASVSLIVNTEWQNRGIGRALLTNLLELADKWLLLKRVELDVSSTNENAIHLYKSLGFVEEGHMKYTLITDGKLTDSLIMGRYRNICPEEI